MFSSLPNFFQIGAAKSGTTSLYSALRQHPEIFLPSKKEPNFFRNEEHFSKGIEWYKKEYYQTSESYAARGDATTTYLFWSSKVSKRIKKVYSDRPIKFVAIFRDPVQRALSAYGHRKKYAGEILEFEAAVKDENWRASNYRQELVESDYFRLPYMETGNYASQLGPFLELFPREHFHFLLFEDLTTNFRETMQKLYEFLEVDSKFDVVLKKLNSASRMRSVPFNAWVRRRSKSKEFLKKWFPYKVRHRVKRSLISVNEKRFDYSPMKLQTEIELREYYDDDIKKLELIMGRSLSHWYAKADSKG